MDTIRLFFVESDDEDCTDMRLERRGLRCSANDIMEMTDKDFQKNFRVNKDAFKYILSEFESNIVQQKRQGALTAKDKLAACLRFLAEGSYQHGIGKDFNVNVAQSTFSLILSEVLDSLEGRLCSKWISLHMDRDEERDAKTAFFQTCSMPGITMAVDGTHVKIKAPKSDKHLFFNRKGYYSINVMIICDHSLKIRYVSAQFPGSCHDSHIWEMNHAKPYFATKYRNGMQSILLGDKGYPLQPWLLTPFREPIDCERKRRFNTAHAKGRIVVERTIGVLKNVFRCLISERGLHYDPAKAARIINLCCALHNIRLYYNVTHEDISIPTYEEDESGSSVIGDFAADEANEIRNRILEYF